MDFLQQLEILWILAVQSLGAWLSEPMRLVSLLGQEEFFMLFMPVLYWSLDPALGFRMAVMLLLGNGVNWTCKYAFHSPRPFWVDPSIKAYGSETSFGLPSNHAQIATGIWGLIAATARRRWVKVGLALLIFLVGFSRVYLGVHFISDVIAGWLIGVFLLWLFLKLERPIAAWLRSRNLAQLLSLALLTSILLLLAMLTAAALQSNWEIPPAWVQNALLSQSPEPNPLNLDPVFTIAGTWLGFMAGAAWIYRRNGGFSAGGTPRQRLLRYLIGLAGIFVLWFGLGQVFPRNSDAPSYGLRFARYTLVGMWISALAPLVFERLGLAQNVEKKIASLSAP